MNLNKNAKIGVWGYGVVGKAITNYYCNLGYAVSIMDKRTFTLEEKNELHQKKINIFDESQKEQFFISHDYLFSSPGVNIVFDYQTHKSKWLHELDVFAHLFEKPIIAITGSIGKTSVTTMLASLLKAAHKPLCVGGNIGTATFDLLQHKNIAEYAILETSSFQLQNCTTFAPQLAIWTNLYPNHLDYHASLEEYFLAKYAIMAHQNSIQHALINLALRSQLPLNTTGHKRSYFSQIKPEESTINELSADEQLYYCENNAIMRYHNNQITPLLILDEQLITFSFLENIVLLTAACDILNINPQLMYSIPHNTQLPEHRLEKIATINGIDFYNDSKSTTTISTLAAVEKLHHRPLHLFLGGLSKGVDRGPFVAQLKSSVKYIYCFGKEANELHKFCIQNGIPAKAFTDLENAFNACTKNIQHGDIVLLSPAGSSYDLYTIYTERGTHFKNLVKKISNL